MNIFHERNYPLPKKFGNQYKISVIRITQELFFLITKPVNASLISEIHTGIQYFQ